MKTYFARAAALTLVLLAFFRTEALAAPSSAQIKAAMQVQARQESELLSLPGVVAVGVGMSQDGSRAVLRVHVDTSAGNPVLPPTIEGLSVQRVDLPGPIEAKDQCLNPANAVCLHQQPQKPPIKMGVETSPNNFVVFTAGANMGKSRGFVGTMGFRVQRNAALPNVATDVGYITNNHVAANNEFLNAAGDTAGNCPTQVNPQFIPTVLDQCQPGQPNPGPCLAAPPPGPPVALISGSLVQVVPIVMSPLAGGSFRNTMDVAFVLQNNLAPASNSILDLGIPTGPIAPMLGQTVCKSGRTTGLTAGNVVAINTTVLVRFTNACGTPQFVNQAAAVFVNQIDVVSKDGCNPQNGFIGNGDSGSPLVVCYPACRNNLITSPGVTPLPGEPPLIVPGLSAVGLMFAGNSDVNDTLGSEGFANRLDVVLPGLGVHLF